MKTCIGKWRDYRETYRYYSYPSCLVLGWLSSGDPLHISCSRGDKEPSLRIVTVYQPDDDKWESNYKTRKVRK
ncbi:MAG: DUF4258 domain-containing protein [Nitrospirota bacterium]